MTVSGAGGFSCLAPAQLNGRCKDFPLLWKCRSQAKKINALRKSLEGKSATSKQPEELKS